MQATLERAIEAVTQEPTTLSAAGRTDAGAHALGQVVAFGTNSGLAADVLQRAFNAHLPRSVAVTAVWDADETFHPRFDAYSRVYQYLIWNRPVRSPFYEGRAHHVWVPLDERAMQAAAAHLVGFHDVSAFVPVQTELERSREVYRAECRRDGDLVTVELEASGFMKQMVRAIVGTLVDVGAGKLSPEDFMRILASRDRTQAGETAPAHGLYMAHVRYSPDSNPTYHSTRVPSPLPVGADPEASKETR